MAHEQQTNKTPEHGESMPDGIAPERVGNGTFDGDWQPGSPDPNVEIVYAGSSPDTPGIRPQDELYDIDGIRVTRSEALRLGLIQE